MASLKTTSLSPEPFNGKVVTSELKKIFKGRGLKVTLIVAGVAVVIFLAVNGAIGLGLLGANEPVNNKGTNNGAIDNPKPIGTASIVDALIDDNAFDPESRKACTEAAEVVKKDLLNNLKITVNSNAMLKLVSLLNGGNYNGINKDNDFSILITNIAGAYPGYMSQHEYINQEMQGIKLAPLFADKNDREYVGLFDLLEQIILDDSLSKYNNGYKELSFDNIYQFLEYYDYAVVQDNKLKRGSETIHITFSSLSNGAKIAVLRRMQAYIALMVNLAEKDDKYIAFYGDEKVEFVTNLREKVTEIEKRINQIEKSMFPDLKTTNEKIVNTLIDIKKQIKESKLNIKIPTIPSPEGVKNKVLKGKNRFQNERLYKL